MQCAIAGCKLRCANPFFETCIVLAGGAFDVQLQFRTFFNNNARYEDINALSFVVNWRLIGNENDKSFFKNVIIKKFKKQFHFFICILPDHLSHKSSKEFWKNSHFENMRADFLRRCQNSLWQTSPEIMHFQAWKKEHFN